MITRERALELLKEHVKTPNLVKHALAVEAVMRAFARKFGEDEEVWGLAGLLHDLDYEYTKDKPEEHCLRTLEFLKDEDVPQDVLDAILAHCDKKPREKLIEKVIYAVDPVTGFIVAAALVRPDKKLEGLKLKSLKKRFKEKAFARGASREQMRSCEEFGVSLDEFLQISLDAMKEIADDLGL